MPTFLDTLHEKLEATLRKLPINDPKVRVFPSDSYHLMAQIVSDSYEQMDEAERQRMVWNLIHRSLDDHEQRRVEFVYTDAPSELDDEHELPAPATEGDR